MKWITASERLPANKVDVFIKEYGGLMDIGWYSEDDERFHTESDLGPLSIHQVYWLDENPPTPASAEDEAKALYPDAGKMNKRELPVTIGEIQEAKRQAHITCARMYTDTIDKLKAENSKMRKALGKSLEWIADVKQKDVPLDDKKGMALYHIKWLLAEALKNDSI